MAKTEPQNSKHNMSIRPPKGKEDLKERMEKAAAKSSRSLNEIVVKLMENYLQNPIDLFKTN